MADIKKKSFFERLTGSMRVDENDFTEEQVNTSSRKNSYITSEVSKNVRVKEERDPFEEAYTKKEEEEEDGELPIDIYETDDEIIVQTFVAGVRPDELHISITRDTMTIKGKRQASSSIEEDNYYVRELYWGSFSRSVDLPAEVEPEEAEAVEKHGLIIIKLPKIDKEKRAQVKIKSI
jgi:HSP20 family protein